MDSSDGPRDDGPSAARTSTGWTNEHVADGFDVDGSQGRVHRLSTGTRYAVARALYAFLGELYLSFARSDRSKYRLIRWLGSLSGRRHAAEQRIAEEEYVVTMVRQSDRPRRGSRDWLLGGGLVLGYLLAILGGMGLVFAFVLGVVPPVTRFEPVVIVLAVMAAGGVSLMLLVGVLLDRSPP